MNKRVIIKTIMICCGIFFIFVSIGAWVTLKFIKLDLEEEVAVIVANMPIPEGTLVSETLVREKLIKVSAYNKTMVKRKEDTIGKRTVSGIEEGDYLRMQDLIDVSEWIKDDQRIRTLPMDVGARQANLVKKGSLVDLKVKFANVKALPRVVLSKIKVEDVVDENGLVLGSSGNGKTAYLKVILDKEQREKIDIAMDMGTVYCELYGNETQKPAEEDFLIPAYYYEQTAKAR